MIGSIFITITFHNRVRVFALPRQKITPEIMWFLLNIKFRA